MSWRTSALGLFVGLLEGTTEGSGVGNADVGMAVCLRVGCVITAMNHKEEGTYHGGKLVRMQCFLSTLLHEKNTSEREKKRNTHIPQQSVDCLDPL